MRERDVEKYLVMQLKVIGLSCVKFVPEQNAGMPDRLVLMPEGKCMWVELKTIGGRLSPLQEYTHQLLREQGQTVQVVWNKEQVDTLVREIKKSLSGY